MARDHESSRTAWALKVKKLRQIFHLHVPKTGGQTLGYRLTSSLPPELSHYFNGDLDAEGIEALVRDGRKLVISAHVSGPALAEVDDLDVVSVLRQPIDQIVSNYLHVRREVNHPLHALSHSVPYAELFDLVPEWFFNHQSAYVVGAINKISGLDLLTPRVRWIASRLFDSLDRLTWLGVTDKLDDFARMVSMESGVPLGPNVRINVAPDRDETLVADLRGWLAGAADRFSLDLMAYEEACLRQARLRKSIAEEAMAAVPRGRLVEDARHLVVSENAFEARLISGWFGPRPNTAWRREYPAGPDLISTIHFSGAAQGASLAFDIAYVAGMHIREIQFLDEDTGKSLAVDIGTEESFHSVSIPLWAPEGRIAVVCPRAFPRAVFTKNMNDIEKITFSAGRWRYV